jgi:ribosome biogenesis GTPase
MRGTVIKSTGSWYNVLSETGEIVECRMKGTFRMQNIKNTNPIAVGDKVEFEKEGEEENGMITEIEKRKNYIIRRSINLSKQTHIVAANIDQAFLIITYVQPRTSTGFIDRFLVTAEAYGIPVNIVINKTDLYSKSEEKEVEQLLSTYRNIGYKCYTASAIRKKGTAELKKLMSGKTNLLAGHSGAGKSTLINSIDGTLDLKIGEISEAHHKGKHTTTYAEMFPLKAGGFIIDTPGIKELGLVDMDKYEIAHYFPEMKRLLNQCKFNNCLHLNEPKCAVRDQVEKGLLAESRYYSYLSILNGEELIKEYDD